MLTSHSFDFVLASTCGLFRITSALATDMAIATPPVAVTNTLSLETIATAKKADEHQRQQRNGNSLPVHPFWLNRLNGVPGGKCLAQLVVSFQCGWDAEAQLGIDGDDAQPFAWGFQ